MVNRSQNAKILYIDQPHFDINNGGAKIDFRNERIIREYFLDRFNIIHLPVPNKFNKILCKICVIPDGLTYQSVKNINQVLRDKKPHIIFIPSSRYGLIARYAKKNDPECICITFFANVEQDFSKQFLKIWNVKSVLLFLMCRKAEKLSIKYSDNLILLNQRDYKLLNKYYKNIPTVDFIPVSSKDCFDITKINSNRCSGKKALFVGSKFKGNIEGLDYFISNVLPYVNIHLTIIGSRMDEYYHETDKITVKGFVNDLGQYYYDADFIISPTISGGGMKTKIAEAMMYGKVIIGSKNAFEGYIINNIPQCILCKSSEDYIREINQLEEKGFSKYNKIVRSLFISKYSDNAVKKQLVNVIKRYDIN